MSSANLTAKSHFQMSPSRASWVSGAEMQALAVDTRSAASWVPRSTKRCFLNCCAERVARIRTGRMPQNAWKHWEGLPLLQAEVRNLKNTVWKTLLWVSTPEFWEKLGNYFSKVSQNTSKGVCSLSSWKRRKWRKWRKMGHPQNCVCPDVCSGIAHASGKAPLSGQGVC